MLLSRLLATSPIDGSRPGPLEPHFNKLQAHLPSSLHQRTACRDYLRQPYVWHLQGWALAWAGTCVAGWMFNTLLSNQT